ncbi:MAG: alanine racemase [Chloroflexota bacterium]
MEFSAPTPVALEVDLSAVETNVRAIRAHVGNRTALCAVVKADGYGLGASTVARAALAAGAACTAVARVREAVALREDGIVSPILLIAGFAADEAEELVHYRVTPTLVQIDDVLTVAAHAARARRIVPVHLKVDTGLNRYGARAREVLALANTITASPWLRLAGLYTHLATADEEDTAFVTAQLDEFSRIRTLLEADAIVPPLVHAANTAAALRFPRARFDLVRVGMALTGNTPSPYVARLPRMRSAVALRAQILRSFTVQPGQSVGYGRTFEATRPVRAALLGAGYADGLARSVARNGGYVLIRGRRAPLMGNVSMDQAVVDVSDIPSVSPGDAATLIGTDGRAEISLAQFAEWSDTISHEALCRIGPRVPRVTLRGADARQRLPRAEPVPLR